MVYKLNKKDGTEFDNAINKAFSEMEFNVSEVPHF